MLEYTKTILIFLLFTNFCMQLLGSSEYKQYVRFIFGMVLLLLVISPLWKWFGNAEEWLYHLEKQMVQNELMDKNAVLFLAEEGRKEKILSSYKEQLAVQLAELLEQEKLQLLQVDIRLCEEEQQYGKVESISMVAQYRTTEQKVVIQPVQILMKEAEQDVLSPMEIYIKNKLADFYNLEEANINVTIQEKEISSFPFSFYAVRIKQKGILVKQMFGIRFAVALGT